MVKEKRCKMQSKSFKIRLAAVMCYLKKKKTVEYNFSHNNLGVKNGFALIIGI